MADIPDFSVPIWDRRDIKAKEVELKYTIYTTVVPILPGESAYANVYTVPYGRRYFVSDCYGTTTFGGSLAVFVPDSHDIYTAYFEPWATHFASLALPIPVESGEIIRIVWINNDAFEGFFRILIGVWWEPGSKWDKPKTDNPEIRFKAGDWNFARYLLEPDGSYSVIFRNWREKQSNYLKIKNAFQEKEEKLASGKLSAEEVQNIVENLHTKPENIKKILNKYEQKYKIKKRA